MLDIFGFEAFQHNRFVFCKEICVIQLVSNNYASIIATKNCNFTLMTIYSSTLHAHHLASTYVYRMEQNEYRSEGINVDAITVGNSISMSLMHVVV